MKEYPELFQVTMVFGNFKSREAAEKFKNGAAWLYVEHLIDTRIEGSHK